MQGHSIKFKRGTIWFCSDDDYEDANKKRGFINHVQKKTRPVLIISSDYGNSHSPVLNVVPLTTVDKRSSVSVAIVSEDGTLSCILCNQIKTVDAKQMIKYVSTVDDETMAEVERVINFTLGIKNQKIEKSLEDIENIIQDIITKKFSEVSDRSEFDNMVTNIATALENTYKNLIEEYVNAINSAPKKLKESAPELDKISEIHKNKQKSNNGSDKKRKYTKSNKPRGYWTLERKEKFVKDYESNTIEWMMINYQMPTGNQVTKRYYNFKHELKNKSN